MAGSRATLDGFPVLSDRIMVDALTRLSFRDSKSAFGCLLQKAALEHPSAAELLACKRTVAGMLLILASKEPWQVFEQELDVAERLGFDTFESRLSACAACVEAAERARSPNAMTRARAFLAYTEQASHGATLTHMDIEQVHSSIARLWAIVGDHE